MENKTKVVTGVVRLSYANIAKPKAFKEGDEPSYNATLLIPKDSPDVAKIKAALKALYDANAQSTFKRGEKVLPFGSDKLWNPLRDGDEWLEEHPSAKEYEGCYFLKASARNMPGIYDKDKQEILNVDQEIYSGVFARAAIQGYVFNKEGNIGYGFFLNSLMKIKDGDRLGGNNSSPDDFDDEDTETNDFDDFASDTNSGEYTETDVQKAGKAYFEANGVPAFKEVLSKLKVNKLSELKPSQYPKFMELVQPEDDLF